MKRSERIRTRPWDPAEYLKTEADRKAYLEAALEDGDAALIALVLDDIERAGPPEEGDAR